MGPNAQLQYLMMRPVSWLEATMQRGPQNVSVPYQPAPTWRSSSASCLAGSVSGVQSSTSSIEGASARGCLSSSSDSPASCPAAAKAAAACAVVRSLNAAKADGVQALSKCREDGGYG